MASPGLGGDAERYYDPDNSFLHRVLERRRGIPISLAVVMIEVGAAPASSYRSPRRAPRSRRRNSGRGLAIRRHAGRGVPPPLADHRPRSPARSRTHRPRSAGRPRPRRRRTAPSPTRPRPRDPARPAPGRPRAHDLSIPAHSTSGEPHDFAVRHGTPRQQHRRAHVGAFGERLPLTLSVERAAGIVGVSRTAMYAAVRRGDFESIRVNGRVAVLTVPLLRRIGVDALLEPSASPPQITVEISVEIDLAEVPWPIGQAETASDCGFGGG